MREREGGKKAGGGKEGGNKMSSLVLYDKRQNYSVRKTGLQEQTMTVLRAHLDPFSALEMAVIYQWEHVLRTPWVSSWWNPKDLEVEAGQLV